ncbi:hypothetical protein P9196_09375 [Xylella fastidiosa subsp. multiplex]|nr:hypothetical protein [Xylella fastidiosa]MDG4872828.1 hypothetical protein [Xylella fastidiosa subsp. multiplex]
MALPMPWGIDDRRLHANRWLETRHTPVEEKIAHHHGNTCTGSNDTTPARQSWHSDPPHPW